MVRTTNDIYRTKVNIGIYQHCEPVNNYKFEVGPYDDSSQIILYPKSNFDRILVLAYQDSHIRDEDFNHLNNLLNDRSSFSENLRSENHRPIIIKEVTNKQPQKKEKPMIEKIKEQYTKHEDILFPLFIMIALDFFFNDGRFQKKITSTIEGILESVSSRFTKKEISAGDDSNE